MNFFAHALVALRRRAEPRWLLGAMAPDLASMGGLRLRGVVDGADEALAAGVRFHHRSDDAFHGAPGFVALMKAARVELEGRGLSAGPSAAIAHVGTELLLDGALVAAGGVPAAYRLALAFAPGVAGELELRGEGDPAARWRELCDRLATAPVPEGYQEPDFVAERLLRILARRPRLAVDAGREGEVHAWAAAAAPVVAARAGQLMAEVEARLGDGRRPGDDG
ncbi:MAG: hypothetical protein AB7N76_32460 [Planctomycetota bacterium]